tara:strand:+ start:154 stop:306 length:153 start_codon:yes stop_codon:yes gene_type:complete
VYTLAQAFNISPLEVYKMPADLVKDMLIIHTVFKELESEEMEKHMKKVKS